MNISIIDFKKKYFNYRFLFSLRSKVSSVKGKDLQYILSKIKGKLKKEISFLRILLLCYILPDKILYSKNFSYQRWLLQNHIRQSDIDHMNVIQKLFQYQPLVSIIMPVYNTPEKFLRESIESVINQNYPHWELCIADDNSTESYIKPILEEYAAKDSRIKIIFREQNGHISLASNSALSLAKGEFIALLDHDDLLTVNALYEVALLLNVHPEADMVYSDEDKIDSQGRLSEPFFKPDWCPDSFLSRMYTSHLGVYRKSLVNEVGGFKEGYEGSQDYELVLRIIEKTKNIFHISKILYHWRIHSESTAKSLNNKMYAVEAGKKALMDTLSQREEISTISITPGNHYILRYKIKDFKRVSIIIPTKNLGTVLDRCLTSIFTKTEYPNYEILLVDNGSTEKKTHQVIEYWKKKEPKKFQCKILAISFNYSKINNYAVQNTTGDYLLFLNNDTEVLTSDWLNAMVEQVQRPSIGAVGALLLYPDNTIQHAGIVMSIGGVAGHSHKYYPSQAHGYFNQIQTVNNYSAVTAACLMCRRSVFEAVGGFEEDLAVAFNDVDLCLKILTKGYRNVYLPHVKLYHYESKSRGYENTPEKRSRFNKEKQYMQKKWKKYIDFDPCYSPHLTREKENFSIKI